MSQGPRVENPSSGRGAPAGDEVYTSWVIQTQERALDRISDWIRAADSKASPVLAIDTAMIATLTALAARPGAWTPLSGDWIALGSTLLLASLLMVAFATAPQLTGRTRSLIFFGDVASMTAKEYGARIADRVPSAYLDDLNAQCHRNAEIASRKYRWMLWSTLALIGGVAPWLVSVFMIVRG